MSFVKSFMRVRIVSVARELVARVCHNTHQAIRERWNMAWYDVLSSKEQVAKELAGYEVASSPIAERIKSIKEADSFVECTKEYLMSKYDKSTMVAYLDTFHR